MKKLSLGFFMPALAKLTYSKKYSSFSKARSAFGSEFALFTFFNGGHVFELQWCYYEYTG